MAVQIAVVDPLPMFARGLKASLHDDGFHVDEPEDIREWLSGAGTRILLFSVAEGPDWGLLGGLCRVRPDAVVIAVLAAAGPEAYVRALTAGAAGVLPRDATASAVRDVVNAAVKDQSLLPLDVLRSLLAGTAAEVAARPLSDDEVEWLRWLADGMTVARLAERVGYSERMMFRLLSDLYRRLGVDNRTKALIRARDEGWF